MFQETKDLPVTTTPIHPCLEGWRNRVKQARERGFFTNDDCLDAISWDMCAIGEAIKKYPGLIKPLMGTHYPADEKLHFLGSEFSGAVNGAKEHFVGLFNLISSFNEAEFIINNIEHRLNELIMDNQQEKV